jgi:hypothetical protein
MQVFDNFFRIKKNINQDDNFTISFMLTDTMLLVKSLDRSEVERIASEIQIALSENN